MKSILKMAVIGLFSVASYAQMYVVDTIGGDSLQPIVQQQLNQLPNGGSVMVYQQRLIINTTPQNYQKISQFIRQIDQLPQNLTVSVRVANRETTQQQGGFGQIGVINQRVFVNGQWQHHQNQSNEQQLFQITTQSGKPAMIGLSQLIPITQIRQTYGCRPQIWVGQTLINAEQGIQVTPTLLANGQISLQIGQINQKLNQFQGQAMVNGQYLVTNIVVLPKQWTTIGFISNQQQQSGSINSQQISEQLPIQVMVD